MMMSEEQQGDGYVHIPKQFSFSIQFLWCYSLISRMYREDIVSLILYYPQCMSSVEDKS